MKFCGNLHSHTEYSNIRLRDSINRISELIDYAIELGHTCIAFTEHDCLSGHIKVEEYANKIKEKNPNFKVIRGNEIYLVRNGLNADNLTKEDKYYHFILLAKDAIGHKQLREISSRAWKRSFMARGMRRVPTYYQDLIDIVGANPGHIIASTACIGGFLAQQILKSRDTSNEVLWSKIEQWVNKMVNLFGEGNFYLEMQPSKNADQIYVNKSLLKLSTDLHVPFIITTDAHYLKKEDAIIHKAYLNSQNGDREVDSFYATTYMMSDEEIRSFFKYFSDEELEQGFQSIQHIADMCENYTLRRPLKIPELKWNPVLSYYTDYPLWIERIPMLKNFLESPHAADRYLVNSIIDGIHNHPDLQNEEAYNEINACLEMTWVSSNVNNAQWSAYFLNLQRIIDECWNAGSLVGCGRGSGVGFILLYVLGITQINPLRETTPVFRWRFLNPARVSVLDVDVDIEGRLRNQVLNHLREIYGFNRVANVATFGTEKSKSAILTACRGLGIDVDIASYLASMIKSERGMTQTLDQTYYGDEENGINPNRQFVIEMTENYPEVWRIAHKIEGLICRVGIHAGGVIFVDEDFEESTSLMRAPDGTLITQFDLHDDEKASLIKYDLLSVEALDKMHICLDLLSEQGYIESEPTLRATYENVIGIYNLERTSHEMWKMVWEHKIESLFQMEQQSGIQGIALTKPESVDDLAVLNSVIRLMASEKGAEQPLNKFARFKNDISLWYDEMKQYGLTEKEMAIIEPIVKGSYGICESQEKFMQLVQLPECGGFDLTWADRLRKSIAKKNPKEFDGLEKEYIQTVKEKGLSQKLCNYVWKVLVYTSRGYGFNASHTLAYSLIALQEMNLAYHYPIIFWNCACLISDSAGAQEEEQQNIEDYYEPVSSNSDFIEIDNNDDDEDDEDDEEETTSIKKKKKNTTTDYGKISTAINKMKKAGVKIVPPNINQSGYTFVPNADTNTIIYGLKGITKIGDELVASIIANRPYDSLIDFINKNKINKTQIINLIKAGAFDCFGDRIEIMKEYIVSISDQKKDLNLRNMQMLITYKLLPSELDFEIKIFNFNKFIRKNCKDGSNYKLTDYPLQFYLENFDNDDVILESDTTGYIDQKKWEKIYNKYMNNVRNYIKEHKEELLTTLNETLYNEVYTKYCQGSLSKWEMDSISFYDHPHELAIIDERREGFSNFFSLPEEPEIDRIFPTKDGKMVPLYKIVRIIGTVLDKDKNKKIISLLTTHGVVTVKIFGDGFVKYDRQISEKNEITGKKHIIEKSMLARGNKIIVCGIRRGEAFIAKKYRNTPYHLIEQITTINADGSFIRTTRG